MDYLICNLEGNESAPALMQLLVGWLQSSTRYFSSRQGFFDGVEGLQLQFREPSLPTA